ncbi:hypothetical protein HAX54_024781, partial [Datura stramonium]|nr:hypothetical protein [Datura stramonium]
VGTHSSPVCHRYVTENWAKKIPPALNLCFTSLALQLTGETQFGYGEAEKVKKKDFWELEKSFDWFGKTMGQVDQQPTSCGLRLNDISRVATCAFASGSQFTLQFSDFFHVYWFRPAPNLCFAGLEQFLPYFYFTWFLIQ